jgi:hypothetical protein
MKNKLLGLLLVSLLAISPTLGANRLVTWSVGQTLTAANLNAEFNNIYAGTILRSAGAFNSTDDIPVGFGAADPDARIEWETTQSTDSLVIGLGSGNIINIMELADMGVNWGISSQTNPTLFVHSADSGTTTDYIALSHNQTNATILSGGGSIEIQTDTIFSGTTPTVTFGDSGAEDATTIWTTNAQGFYICGDDGTDTLIIGLGTTCGTNPAITLTSDGTEDLTFAGALTVSGAITFTTTLTVAQGGTGAATFTDGGVLLGSGTGAITATAVLSDGQIIIGDGAGDPATIDVGSASGGITILGTVATGTWQGTAITGAYIDPTSSPLASTKIWIGSGSNVAAEFALSGDATMTAGGVVTVGLAATATALASARTIGGTSFDGTANIAVALSATATELATARAINGTDFDGTAAITVTAAAGTLTGGTLNSGVTASSLTSVGTLTSITSSGNLVVSGSGSSRIGAAGTNDGHVHILSPSTSTKALVIEVPASTYAEAFQIHYAGTAYVESAIAAAESRFSLLNLDLGDDVAGPVLTIGRNSNSTNSNSGTLVFRDIGNSQQFIWVDNSAATGDVRIHTAAPAGGVADTAGTIVGTQSSPRFIKNILREWTDDEAYKVLDQVLATPVYDFTYKSGKYNRSFTGIAIEDGEEPWYGMDRAGTDDYVPEGTSKALNEVNIAGYMILSVRALNKKIEDQNNTIERLSDEVFSLQSRRTVAAN